MSWYNPWAEIRVLRERLATAQRDLRDAHGMALAAAEQIDGLRKLCDSRAKNCGRWEDAYRVLAEAHKILQAKLATSHQRDPKTGRIMKKGA